MRTAAFLGVLALGTLFVVRSVPGGHTSERTGPRIIRADKGLDALIGRDAQVEQIAAGFASADGAVWNRTGRFLLFSDTPNNAVFRWREGEGASLYARLFAGAAPRPAALAMDDEGRVVLCERGTGRLTRLEVDGTQTTLAGLFEELHGLVYRRDGSLFFTDSASGVYRLSAKGAVRLVTNAVPSPRGIAFSPDERTLYVSSAEPAGAKWYAFDIDAEGRTKRQRVFFETAVEGTPDGMQVDKHGNLFASGPGGLHMLTAQGRHLGSIAFDQPVSSCAWGGDGSMLYITAGTGVYRVRTMTSGH